MSIFKQFNNSIIFTALIFLIPIFSHAERIALPEIGESTATLVTPVEEYETGKAVLRNIRRAGGILEDPLIEEYINNLGYSLLANSSSNMKNFHFFMLNDKDINAFALPGGFIGINYGLFLHSGSESELASVFAHEIAHVTQRHHARRYEFGNQSNIPAVAAMIAAVILGSGNFEVTEAALATMAATSIQSQLDFTRENEKEADHIGIALLSDSGFDPYSMAGFFETLERNSRLYGAQAPEFLRTHPVNQTRIADARNRASQLPPRPLAKQPSYLLMLKRLQVLTTKDKQQILNTFEKNIKSGNYLDQNAENYGYALALTENKQYKKSRNIIKSLLKKEPQRIAYILALAELESHSNNHKTALKLYTQALASYPENYPLTQNYVETLLLAKQYKTAQKVLHTYLRAHSDKPIMYKLLSQTESKLGHNADAQAALGEYYYLIGQQHQAITQLTQALKNEGLSFYDNTRIEARIKQIQEEIVRLKGIFKE